MVKVRRNRSSAKVPKKPTELQEKIQKNMRTMTVYHSNKGKPAGVSMVISFNTEKIMPKKNPGKP